MGVTAGLLRTALGIGLLMVGFATAGFFSSRLSTITALGCLVGGAVVLLWNEYR